MIYLLGKRLLPPYYAPGTASRVTPSSEQCYDINILQMKKASFIMSLASDCYRHDMKSWGLTSGLSGPGLYPLASVSGRFWIYTNVLKIAKTWMFSVKLAGDFSALTQELSCVKEVSIHFLETWMGKTGQ